MSLPVRIVVGLAPQLALIGTVAVAVLNADNGAAGTLMVVGCVAVGIVACVAMVVAQIRFAFGVAAIMVILLATVGMALWAEQAADQRSLHERGRDVACAVTSVDEQHVGGGGPSGIVYGLTCGGGGPQSITDDFALRTHAVGERVEVRYDPADANHLAWAEDDSDGHVPLALAVVSAVVMVGAGVVSAAHGSPTGGH